MCSQPRPSRRGRDVLQRQLQRRQRQRRRSFDRRMLAHCPLTSRACIAHRSLYVVDAGVVRASAKGCGVAQQRIAAAVERRTHSLYDAYASFRAWPATGAPVCAHVDVTDELKSQSASLYLEENSSHSFPAPRGCTSTPAVCTVPSSRARASLPVALASRRLALVPVIETYAVWQRAPRVGAACAFAT